MSSLSAAQKRLRRPQGAHGASKMRQSATFGASASQRAAVPGPEAYCWTVRPGGFSDENEPGDAFSGRFMDVQDFMIQGEGHEEDKREAWTLFQQAYGHQMKGELEEAVVSLIRNRSTSTRPRRPIRFSVGLTVSWES